MFHISETTRRLFAREALHTILAWVVLVVIVAWMTICQQWSDMRWWRWYTDGHHGHGRGGPPPPHPSVDNQPLRDILLDNLPFVPQGWVSDALVNTAGLFSVVGCMLMARGWQAKLVLLRRVAWMMGVLYFLRSITISLTTMPPSIKGCVPVLPKDTNELLAHIPGSFTGEVGACTDKIFSGHTTILVISFLFWTRYARHWAFIAYSAIHTIAGILSVLAVRYHYSIDVLLAIILTYFVHHAYYGALDRAILLRDMLAGRHSYSTNSALPITGPAKRASEYVYDRVQEGSEDDIEELFEQSPADAPTMAMSDSEKPQMRTSPYVSVPMPVAADEECLEKGYYVASDRNANSVDSMVVNRPMSRTLPKVVAWMDGLHFR
ncbi:hypothetical protein DL89DRAFT_266064 [Linderina pennispora]|uniref:Sphingomyelin synthase-like domain-containing protein n=1 Tax=Linderina pennispora TaxID=61395 RepID=A0A1Y1WGX2_9FUNG|nr:uncharacterized protein DL89DRAFT_266064 [Linderina pennispora]ORX72486.1 hypothetical protein DL89DRAFT_266064 [Linderina pennispora]